jgi:hypothetical protein
MLLSHLVYSVFLGSCQALGVGARVLIIDPLEGIIINTAKAWATLPCFVLTLSGPFNYLTLSVPVTKPADAILQRLLVLAPSAQL